MKKILLAVTIASALLRAVFGENQNLSALMKSSYESGFYPGVVRYAEEILRTEKDSLASFRAAVYAGESLFRMGRERDARRALEARCMNGESLNPEAIQLNAARFFWLGRVLFSEKEFDGAHGCFFNAASVFRELEKVSTEFAGNSADYYSLSILYGAKSYYESGRYPDAIPLYEYVISNGAKFSVRDYADSAVALAICYNAPADKENARKCVAVVSSLEKGNFDADTKSGLMLQKGMAHETLGELKAANEAYRAAGALSKASETATMLAISAYENQDFEESLSYFGDSEKDASSGQKKIAAVYRAEIAYETAEDKGEGCSRAVEILRQILKSEKIGKNGTDPLDETILLSLARYNAYLKDWRTCESFASRCKESRNPGVARNAVYWIALSKYETGDALGAVSAIESYKKTNAVEDRQTLSLYAKALAKQGKYQEADRVFNSLWEKNRLDNDGRLDYSRTLLIAGRYDAAKEQAAMAAGDESLYLFALASFNQRHWKEAEDSFGKVLSSESLGSEYVAYARFYSAYAQYQQGDYAKSAAGMSHFIEENPLHPFVWSASMTRARACAFMKDDEQAALAAEQAIKTARSEPDRQESLLLAAGILSDAGKPDDALLLLRPYISRKTEFGYECKYRSAEMLARQGKIPEADACFAQLASLTDKKAALVAEESSYRRAELAYSEGDFVKSAELFEAYGRRFAGGKFAYAAVYFSADSLARIGDDTRAILRYEQITDSPHETPYRYGAEKNLVSLYEKTGDYDSALSMANRMLSEYGSQAADDGMAKKAGDLQSLGAGTGNSAEERIRAAEQGLERRGNDASQSGANLRDALFLAGAYRSRGENKKSAGMYLEAAKYARQAGDDGQAARSFYGALESFDAAGLYADARATFAELKKLYPGSRYTKDGEKIAGQP